MCVPPSIASIRFWCERTMVRPALLSPSPIGVLTGLLHALGGMPGPTRLSAVVRRLHCGLDEIVHAVRAGEQLGLVVIAEGDVALTDAGRRMAAADEPERKAMFRRQAQTLPIFEKLLGVFASNPGEVVPRWVVRQQLSAALGRKIPDGVLDTAINWGRYAGLFDYDAATEDFLPCR